MTTSLLHPIMLTALEAERSRSAPVGSVMALLLAILVLGLLLA